jgi:hypothetical protein
MEQVPREGAKTLALFAARALHLSITGRDARAPRGRPPPVGYGFAVDGPHRPIWLGTADGGAAGTGTRK